MKRYVLIAVLLFLAAPAWAADMELKGIMKDLDAKTLAIVDGINKGDFEAVGNTAKKISDHEEPSFSEKIKILGFLLTDAKDFKSFGDVVHDEAERLAEAAKNRDYDGAIVHFAAMLKGCSGCHAGYREKFVKYFYK
jgi:cytochrome c556